MKLQGNKFIRSIFDKLSEDITGFEIRFPVVQFVVERFRVELGTLDRPERLAALRTRLQSKLLPVIDTKKPNYPCYNCYALLFHFCNLNQSLTSV